jgi:glycyl-tRNA synthetase
MVQERDDMVGQDASILMHPRVWEASGHLEGFTDPLVDCKKCRQRFRADHLTTDVCPECGGELTEPRNFNLMFKTFMGPVEDQAAVVYLRPETAQGIFVNFHNILTTTRKRLPFGVAQIGKSFRNEITPGNFTFRTREFEQMEIEYFVKPGTDEEHFNKWVEERYKWYKELGISPERLRLRPHDPEELAHYAKACIDIEYYFPMGWSELEGIANRTDYDLKRHAEYSGSKLEYFDHEINEHYVPYVVEPSAGADRATLAFLVDAYHEEPDKDETRVVLRFHPEIAPVKVAVLPLSRKEPLTALAKELSQELRRYWNTEYDDAKSIGRRYRRQDEIGTPFCVTVDFQSPEDQTVTVRERDTMAQTRLPVAELVPFLREKLETR